jgi:hypothetical protein
MFQPITGRTQRSRPSLQAVLQGDAVVETIARMVLLPELKWPSSSSEQFAALHLFRQWRQVACLATLPWAILRRTTSSSYMQMALRVAVAAAITAQAPPLLALKWQFFYSEAFMVLRIDLPRHSVISPT